MSQNAPSLQPWKILRSQYVLETPWIRVRRDACELPDRSVIDDYYVAEYNNVVGIVAITPEQEVVCNLQYKHGIQEVVREIPAGIIETGEEPEAAARRELEEETGYATSEWHHLSTLIASPSGQTHRYHIFLAVNAQPTGTKQDDPREQIVNELIPLAEVNARIMNGSISAMWTIAAMHIALEWIKQKPQ